MHILISKLTIIGSDNGLSPGQRQAIIWIDAGILLIHPLIINFSEILRQSQRFFYQTKIENVVCEMAAILSPPQCVNGEISKRIFSKPHPDGSCSHGYTWWRHQLGTFSTLLALCAGNSSVTGEFPAQSPLTWSFDIFFDLHLNKRLSKQSRGWWFETPSCPLWCHCNDQTWLWHIQDSLMQKRWMPSQSLPYIYSLEIWQVSKQQIGQPNSMDIQSMINYISDMKKIPSIYQYGAEMGQ